MDIKISEAPVLEPTTQRFIDALASRGGKPIYQLSIADAREVLEGLQRQPIEKLPAQEEDITIPGGPNGKVSARIIRPANSTGKLPVIMYTHGGAGYWGAKTPTIAWFARSPTG
jgi:acetyl esterase